MKTKIWVSFNYYSIAIVFSRTFDLPFTPFFGMTLRYDDENEYFVELKNDDSCITFIDFNLQKNCLEINVRHTWKHAMYNTTIDNVLKSFNSWFCHQTEKEINELKLIMEADISKM